MIDQNDLKIHEEIMKISRLSACNFVTRLTPLLVFFHYFSRTLNLKNTYFANIFWCPPPFYVNSEKTSKEGTNEAKVKVKNKEFSFK